MKTLGVSMIVRNETEEIESCLESIKGADEIVIVDTGSEDNTVEICKKYTSNVFTDYKWNDDFSEARNVALSRCTADWILIIDADEQFADDIQKVKDLLNSSFIYSPSIKSEPYLGLIFKVHTKMETIDSIRVIRNNPDIQWIYAVHNNLSLKGNPEALRKRCYKTHFEIKSDYSQAHLKDPDRSLRILQKQLEKDPTNSRYMYYMAREYISRRMRSKTKEEAQEWIAKTIETLEKHYSLAFYKPWEVELQDALYCLSLAYGEMAGFAQSEEYWYKAVETAAKAFVVNPDFQAPADTLAIAMTAMPGKMKYPMAAFKWKNIADNCKNANTVFLRKRIDYKLTPNCQVVYPEKNTTK